VLTYLAAAGVGGIRCVDADLLDLTNLQRQVLYSTEDVGKSKSAMAYRHIRALNPEIELDFRSVRFNDETANELLEVMDLVLETSDNFETKFLVNDACIAHRTNFIMGGILRFDGQVFSVRPRESACYRCIFFKPPPADTIPTCAGAGVIGAVAVIVGSIMAGETIKILLGFNNSFGLLQQYNLLDSTWRNLRINRNARCPVCA